MPRTIQKILFAKNKHKYELTQQELREYERLKKKRQRYIKLYSKNKTIIKLRNNTGGKYKYGIQSDEGYTPNECGEGLKKIINNDSIGNNAKINQIFKPGGDYKNENYIKEEIIIDNLPFSKTKEICAWYNENKIKFILIIGAGAFYKINLLKHKWRKNFYWLKDNLKKSFNFINDKNESKSISIGIVSNIENLDNFYTCEEHININNLIYNKNINEKKPGKL